MSSSYPNQIIEHIVLFKAKPNADPSAVNAMLGNLNSLISLDSVLYLSAGPVSRCRSNSLTFTHILHSRYRSKPDLNSYSENPNHVSVVANYVKPVVDDVMAVDWVAGDFSNPPVVSPGSAIRLTILKLKEGTGESCKSEVLGILKGVEEKSPPIKQLTVGRISRRGGQGFLDLLDCGFQGLKELEAMDTESELSNEQKDKVDGVVVLDYVVVAASAQSASL
ncbi:hypothetical protein DH2020_018553 [Rehmannia glutinosa]|uniref:Stress-response A/B barrel domain-containing protein n=1 Tax=Rehmannia glutinosa TaxID=99300 RepID=A0ABR0WL85_REHGL